MMALAFRSYVGLFALSVVMGSCQSPVAPSPSPRPDALTIVPSMDAVKLGETQSLSAVVVSGDGARRPVSAAWSSDAPAVAAVSDDGRVRAVSLGSTQIHATFQSMSAVEPLRVVPDYAGSWSGEYHVVACNRTQGDGPDVCRTYLAGGGIHLPLSVIVNQSGSTVSGTFDLYSNTHILLETGPVGGAVDTSGALVLSVSTQSVHPTEHSATTVSDWVATLTDGGSHLTGEFTLTQTFQNAWGAQTLNERCELLAFGR
jgi:hypothetical protein